MLLGLSTTNKIGLASVAVVFIVFALVVALVIPRWRPDFPGERGRNWFVFVTVVLLVAMLGAVEVFAKEDEEAAGHKAGEVAKEKPGGGEPQPSETTAGGSAGDAAAGKTVFTTEGCGGCHAFSAAGTDASVGPNLDEALSGEDTEFIRTSIVDPDAEVAQGFPPGVMPSDYGEKLSPKQITDLVAFLSKK